MRSTRRIILKLSGEAFQKKGASIDAGACMELAKEIRILCETGLQLGIVVGGGNHIRGLTAVQWGLERVVADNMGMLGTVINALGLQSALEQSGIPCRVMTAVRMTQIAEPLVRRKAIRHLEKGRVVIFAAGTGNPFFSTDTAAAMRAAEVGAESLLKATKVDGVYSSDPIKDSSAVKYDKLTFSEVLSRDLRVMDSTAVSLCRENRIPIYIFSLRPSGNIGRVIAGESTGTVIKG